MDGSDNALLWGVRIRFEQSQEEPWKMRQVSFNLSISLAALSLKLLHTYGIFIASSEIFPCGTWTLAVALKLSSVANGLGCSKACGILAPRPGIELSSPVLQGRFLTTGPPEKSHEASF